MPLLLAGKGSAAGEDAGFLNQISAPSPKLSYGLSETLRASRQISLPMVVQVCSGCALTEQQSTNSAGNQAPCTHAEAVLWWESAPAGPCRERLPCRARPTKRRECTMPRLGAMQPALECDALQAWKSRRRLRPSRCSSSDCVPPLLSCRVFRTHCHREFGLAAGGCFLRPPFGQSVLRRGSKIAFVLCVCVHRTEKSAIQAWLKAAEKYPQK